MPTPGGVQEILAASVLAALEEQNIRQRDLAAAAGVSEKHLSQMLTGKTQGTLAMWDRLFAALA